MGKIEPGYPSFKETKHGTQPIIVSFFFFFFKKFKTDVTQPIIVTGPFWDPDLNKPKAKDFLYIIGSIS